VLVDFLLLSGLLAGLRLFIVVRYRGTEGAPASDMRPRAVIFGANKEGLKALRVLGGSKTSPYRIVGFIDDAEEKFAKKISGVKVLGNRHHIGALAILHNIQEVILAPEDESRERIDEVVALAAKAGIRSRIFSGEAGDESAGRILYSVRSLQLADMLPQVRVPMDEGSLRTILSEKTTLMMGSGGELGSAVCRQLFRLGCRKLVIVDRYESRLSRIMAELIRDLPGFSVVPVVADSEDLEDLDRVFLRHRPDIVLHAGMRKFIPFQKTADEDVARANYLSTFNLARIAARHGCEYFLVISSINAARRGSFISESLRVAEISLSRIFDPTSTRLIVNRVGNIIENTGGIVSWLNEQILQRRSIPLPAEAARAFLLSRIAGARSILQSLATGSKISPGGQLLTSEPGIGLEYGEVARRIAGFYGIQPGFDLSVDLDEIPDALLFDRRPAITGSGNLGSVFDFEKYPDSDRARDIIQNLISSETGRLSKQEWIRRTREILALVDQLEREQKNPLSLN
jgi:FlaA1/EpsC-like NDP-sugar epimerase